MKKCSNCKQNKPEGDFSFKSKVLGILHSQCKMCTRILIKNHYSKNRDYYLEKANKRNSKLRYEVIEYLNDYLLKHPCKDCGESDIRVLDFDHNGKESKFKAVSSLIRNRYTLDVVKKEVDKCDVRCANCHRRKTAVEFNWSKNNMRL